MRVRSTKISLWVCEECEATWKSPAEVNVTEFEDYGTLMVGIGRKPLWSELEPQ
jgi:ribosomal protein L37AE/L43A